MEKEEILKQCLEWNAKIEKRYKKVGPGRGYFEHQEKMKKFTKENSGLISAPKYEVLSICSQTIHDQEKYPVFFVRERQIFEKKDGLTWVYLGSLFDLSDDKVNYQTTTSYIPEKYLEDLVV